MAEREKVAVDLDDVLSLHVPAFIAFTNANFGANAAYEDYDEDWRHVWGFDITHEEIERRKQAFFSGEVLEAFDPIPGAAEALGRIAGKRDLAIVTSRREVLRAPTERWLDRHYGGLFSEVALCGYVDTTGFQHSLSKAEVCARIGAKTLIDDSIIHCRNVAATGVRGLLFGGYHWSPYTELPDLVEPVQDWPAVEAYFDRTDTTGVA